MSVSQKKDVSSEKSPNEVFLELIPRRKDTNVSGDADGVSCKRYQDELLQLCGYDSRSNDAQRILYSKIHFILNHKESDTQDDRRRVLLLLLADCGCLFGTGNSSYRDAKINEEYYHKARKSQKDAYGIARFDVALPPKSVWSETIDWPGHAESIAQCLLAAIQEDADKKNHSAAWWLYRRDHAEVTDQNRAECIENYLTVEKHIQPAAYSKEQKNVLTQSKDFQRWFGEQRRLAERGDELNHVWLLNLKKCGESCWELIRSKLEGTTVFQQTEAACHNPSDVEDFVLRSLIPYLYKCKNARIRIDGLKKKSRLAARNEIELFREEYQLLECLSKEYLNQKCDGDEEYLDEHLYSGSSSYYGLNSPMPVKSVLNAILEYARHRSTNKNEEINFNCIVRGMQFLYDRVYEMFTNPQLKKDGISRVEYPLIVFHDVHTYGPAYFINEEISREFYGSFVRWFDHAGSRPNQRVQQLCFLRKLCDIFKLSLQERARNYAIYLKVYGSSIKSRGELEFWKREISEGCSLPTALQFQMEVYDAWQSFLPSITETLSYKPASSLHLHGFQRFCKVKHNWKLMQDLSGCVCDYVADSGKSIVGEYEKALARPLNHQEVQDLLAQFPDKMISLEEYDTSMLVGTGNNTFDENELLSLIKETAIRQYLWERAKKKVAKQMQAEFGFSLLKMDNPKGGNPIKGRTAPPEEEKQLNPANRYASPVFSGGKKT